MRCSWWDRMSGFGGVSGSELEVELDKRGIRTLLFAGVNADQVDGAERSRLVV
jgi:nicotinamidase-related amidase